MNNWTKVRNKLFLITTLITIMSCGGDGDNNVASGGTSGTGISSGTMTKGSVIVNGIHFEVASDANIIVDNQQRQPESELYSGMVVKVRGRINADGTGLAETIKAHDDLQGQITSIDSNANPKSLLVLGQKVVVDDLTLYADGLSFTDLAQGNYIEVHGQIDAHNTVRATRIKKFLSVPEVELKGIVSNKFLSGTFIVRGLTISYNNATKISGSNDFNDGDYIEVYLDTSKTPPYAKQIDLEELEDLEFLPAANEKHEEEGYISNYNVSTNTFVINSNTTVQITATTEYEGGTELDLTNNIKVEVEGNSVNGVMTAAKISFKRIRVQTMGLVTGVNTSNNTINIMDGASVIINGLTEISAQPNNTASDIQLNERVVVKGFVDSNGVIVAEEVEETNDTKAIIQAVANSKTASTLTLLGITADFSAANKLLDVSGSETGATAFLTSITLPSTSSSGSLVKLEGTYDAINKKIFVDKAKIEH